MHTARTVRALDLLLEIRELTEESDPDERRYIAWRTHQVANDVSYLAEHRRPGDHAAASAFPRPAAARAVSRSDVRRAA